MRERREREREREREAQRERERAFFRESPKERLRERKRKSQRAFPKEREKERERERCFSVLSFLFSSCENSVAGWWMHSTTFSPLANTSDDIVGSGPIVPAITDLGLLPLYMK